MHEHHESLPGFHPDQLLHDGCGECEHRGADALEAIVHLDGARFARAWARAAAWQREMLDTRTLAHAEIPMLRTLWTIQVMFERFHIAPLGQLPKGRTLTDVLEDEMVLFPVRTLRHHAAAVDSDLNKRITILEREAILTACNRALDER